MMNSTMHSEHSDLCVGIDLGTTNSVLAVINKKPSGDLVSKVVDLNRAVSTYAVPGGSRYQMNKRPLLPSCVYYQPESGYKTIVGDYAKNMYATRPHLVAKSIKSQMGESTAHGLAEEVPDRTPAEISARILSHMLTQLNKTYHTDIKDAVITVPANFDSAMCKATLDAAQMAGIKIKNDDGSERPVLLSEPNAVIYDLINQIHNGEVPANVIDLSSPKNVMVFDLGGGTLDITLHKIRWRDEDRTVLKVDEIATNRYTLLGGDDFDEVIAEEMFRRYLEKYKSTPAAVEKMKREKSSIMSQMRVFAEELKLDFSTRKEEAFEDYGWGEEEGFNVGGHIYNSYAYDDYFTAEDIEKLLEQFMGRNLKFDDFRRFDSVSDSRNIIYPILDVLNKAASRLGGETPRVDALVLNGGMSRFYMVQNRLREFFGFEPVLALDPDQAVARGAAVYHYYLHLNEKLLKDDMRLVGSSELPGGNAAPRTGVQDAARRPAIEFGRSILNESLYLGLKNGAKSTELIRAGEQLPYESPRMNGYKIQAGNQQVAIPIQRANADGTMQTIVKSMIKLDKCCQRDSYVSFTVSMSPSKVLTMRAWISEDPQGEKVSQEAVVDIEIGRENESDSTKCKLAPPTGSVLNANNEMHSLLQLCRTFEKAQKGFNGRGSKNAAAKIRQTMENICACSNKADFAGLIIRELRENTNGNVRMRLFTLSRRICESWTDEERSSLAEICLSELKQEMEGFGCYGAKLQAVNQAIYTLAACGTAGQVARMRAISNQKLTQPILYAFGLKGVNIDWIYEQFMKDALKVQNGSKSYVQSTAYSLGYALRRDCGKREDFPDADKAVRTLLDIVYTADLPDNELVPCILALGWICDQRQPGNPLPAELLQEAESALAGFLNRHELAKSSGVAYKMVCGSDLDYDDEKYLLELVRGYENRFSL